MHSTGLKALVLSLCVTVIFSEMVYAQNKINADESWLKSEKADYSVSYPSKWLLDQRGILGTTFVISDPELVGEFRAKVTLLIQDVTGSGYDLTRYFELSENKLRSVITNEEVIYSKRVKTNSGECQEFIFKGDEANFHLKWRQRYWVKGNKAYVLTFSSSQTAFEDYSLISDKIFNLFAIK